MSEKKFPHYHICQTCAEGKGGKLSEGNLTVIKGICKYCNYPTPAILIPWIDFNWPQDKQNDKLAKVSRD